jgi:hypothetical protein
MILFVVTGLTRMITIYVLLLEGGKYYVGKTNNLEARIEEHIDGRGYGSVWTTTYKPVRLIKFYPETSPYDEENETRRYMNEFGKENVRGGPWVQMTLPSDMENPYLLRRHREGRCARCGFSNHLVSECFARRSADGGPLYDGEDEEDIVTSTSQFITRTSEYVTRSISGYFTTSASESEVD